MKTTLVYILLFTIIISLSGCITNKSFFNNKIIIYSSDINSGRLVTKNSSFIDFYQDTINRIGYPFELFEHIKEPINEEKSPYQLSDVPFQFIKKGGIIYIVYSLKGFEFERKYYSLSKDDSVATSTSEFLCDTTSAYNVMVTKFAGDTILYYANKKIKCWKFKVRYLDCIVPGLREEMNYIDKSSLLPIQTNNIWYLLDSKGHYTMQTEILRIDTVFKRPWISSNKKWIYSKCWRN